MPMRKSSTTDNNVITIGKNAYIDGKQVKIGKVYVTPILPYTKKILEQNNYKLNITSSQKYNQFLKGLGLVLNFSFTSHIARHTLHHQSGKRSSKRSLKIMMNHSSIKTTELYAKLPIEFVTQNLDKKLFNVWK